MANFSKFAHTWEKPSTLALYGATAGAGLSIIDQGSISAPISGNGIQSMAVGAGLGYAYGKFGTGIYNSIKKKFENPFHMSQDQWKAARAAQTAEEAMKNGKP